MNTATPTRTATAGNVRAEMARAGVNQTVVAEWLGIAQSAVSARLRGAVAFDIDELATLAEHLDVPITALIVSPFPGGMRGTFGNRTGQLAPICSVTQSDWSLAA